MTIITTEGKIIEGQELTAEEVSILEELTSNEGVLYDRSGAYLTPTDRRKVSAALIAEYYISRRRPAVQVEEAPELIAAPDAEEDAALEVA